MASKNDVKQILGKLMAAFQFTPRNIEATIEIYAEALSDVPDEALNLAAADWISKEKWFPKIAELRTRARSGKGGHWLAKVIQPELRPSQMLLNSTLQPDLDFCRAIERFENLTPAQWQPGDYREFASIMGREVNFEKDNPEAPWMAWTKPQPE